MLDLENEEYLQKIKIQIIIEINRINLELKYGLLRLYIETRKGLKLGKSPSGVKNWVTSNTEIII